MEHLGTTIQEILEKSPSNVISDHVKVWMEDYPDFDIETMFGGYFFVVENEEDLKQIETPIYNDAENRYYNLSEVAAAFDMFDQIDNNFYRVFLATNNDGGNTYLIPKKLVLDNKNLLRSYQLTEESHKNV